MLGPEIEQPPTDQDRTRVIELLRVASPRLGLEEVDRRMDAAINARSVNELAMLVWDLPGPEAVPARRPHRLPGAGVLHNVVFRFHAAAYAGVNGMLVGIWALTGGTSDIFWPFFPMAGWGIGLGMHGLAVHSGQKRRQAHERRKQAQALAGGGAAGALPAGGYRPSRPARSGPSRTAAVVMFTDVVDSTRLNLVLGDEDWTRLRNKFRDLLRECYSAHAGVEVNSQGDGFLVRFGSAPDAASCAIDIQNRLEAQRDQVGFAPSVRMGINAGETMDNDGDLLGTVVNMAARVMAQAEPNQILVTEAVADRLDGRFQLRDEGLRDLKGLDRSCHLLSLVWA